MEQYSCAHSSAPASRHPTGRVGRPADVAAMVAYLLDGERAGFIVDGGMPRTMIYEK